MYIFYQVLVENDLDKSCNHNITEANSKDKQLGPFENKCISNNVVLKFQANKMEESEAFILNRPNINEVILKALTCFYIKNLFYSFLFVIMSPKKKFKFSNLRFRKMPKKINEKKFK